MPVSANHDGTSQDGANQDGVNAAAMADARVAALIDGAGSGRVIVIPDRLVNVVR